MSFEVAVISDWDADGIVSAAEVVYAQEFLGIYPLNKRSRVRLVPVSAHTFANAVDELSGQSYEAIAVLDIPYVRGLEEHLRRLRSVTRKLIYFDHHISTTINAAKLEHIVDELIVARAPTALLVAHVLRSLGAKLSPRLEAFIRAASAIERGTKRPALPVQRNLIRLVVAISRTLSHSKDRELWERIVRWLGSPIAFAAMPFAQSIESMMRSAPSPQVEEAKALANELAPSSMRIYNLRLVDVRKRRLGDIKLTVLASSLHRILKAPIALVGYSKRTGSPLLILRSRDDLPYRLALKLWERKVVSEVGGHQSLAICVLRQDYSKEELATILRRILMEL